MARRVGEGLLIFRIGLAAVIAKFAIMGQS